LEQLKSLYSGQTGLPANKIVPTVGLNVGKLEVDKKSLVLWDLGGQQGLRTIWDKYYRDAHGVIYVVDSADSKRLDECKKELEVVCANKELEGAPVLIVANKQDLAEALSVEAVSLALNVAAIKTRRVVSVAPVSAIKG